MDFIGDEKGDVRLSPMQGAQLMALAELVRSGEVIIRSGYDADEEHEETVKALLLDVSQEIALQVHNG
jgi:hypothetical protein